MEKMLMFYINFFFQSD